MGSCSGTTRPLPENEASITCVCQTHVRLLLSKNSPTPRGPPRPFSLCDGLLSLTQCS